MSDKITPSGDMPTMDVEEALRLADLYDKRHEDVPSVSRTLAAEVRSLRREIQKICQQQADADAERETQQGTVVRSCAKCGLEIEANAKITRCSIAGCPELITAAAIAR